MNDVRKLGLWLKWTGAVTAALVAIVLPAVAGLPIAAGLFAFLTIIRIRLVDAIEANAIARSSDLIASNMRFQTAIENMRHGISMFDASGRLIVCNRVYLDLYHLDPDKVVPGTSVDAIFAMRRANGAAPKIEGRLFSESLEQTRQLANTISEVDLQNGKTVSVDRKMMADGGWVSIHIDITRRKAAEAKISFLAFHDVLTGLANRQQLRSYFEKCLGRTERGETLAIICMDLDHFKPINDSLGHAIGDQLLAAVAKRLRDSTRAYDMVARTGGDEFAILQVGCDQPSGVAALAERIIREMTSPFEIGEHHIVIGASIGISLAPFDGVDLDQLFRNADMAMYQSKARGRGVYSFFEPQMDSAAQERHQLEQDLRRALAADEFILHYQPIVNLAENRIAGFEALLRWNHPALGLVPPDRFIPLAEETGLIVPIGAWVIREACREAKGWGGDLRVAVNLSPVQFRGNHLGATIFAALAETGLPASRLELEVTESIFLHRDENTLATLHQLRDLGASIAIDDFGAGYSSLGYLQKFPFDKIKVDRSFIRDLAVKPGSIAIIRAVAELGRSLCIATTAEGVETREQFEQMQAEGCTEVQGYFLGRPMPAGDIPRLLCGNAASELAA